MAFILSKFQAAPGVGIVKEHACMYVWTTCWVTTEAGNPLEVSTSGETRCLRFQNVRMPCTSILGVFPREEDGGLQAVFSMQRLACLISAGKCCINMCLTAGRPPTMRRESSGCKLRLCKGRSFEMNEWHQTLHREDVSAHPACSLSVHDSSG